MTISPSLTPWLSKKCVPPHQLKSHCEELRAQGLKIATLNGSFDLLQAGHLFMIHQASLQADRLLVALNSDTSIQQYKSKERPIITLQNRLALVAALEFVSYVTWFEETDPRELLQLIRPDVHVNGEEYGEECIEAEVVRTLGAKLHLVPRIPLLSTTAILQKIMEMKL